MNPTLEIFSQGEEIVTGQTVDTNAAWLSQQAVACGFTVTRHTAVGDKLDDLIALLQDIAQRADCCICTGGLGPTSDDLTAVAVAYAFDRPLIFDGVAYEQISRFFAHRNRAMPASNRKQAMLPHGAERIDNEWGTAPGFALKHGRCWFAFLPGVPMEMKHLFQERILPTLTDCFSLRPGLLVTIKTLGLGESAIQELIDPIEIPASVQLGFRAGADDVQTKLLFPSEYPKMAMTGLVAAFVEQLGDYVFAVDGLGEPTGDLVFEIDKLMIARKHTLAVIETASHGLLAAKCLGSEWLLSASYEQSIRNTGMDCGFSHPLPAGWGEGIQKSANGDRSLYSAGPGATADTEKLMDTALALAVEKQKNSGADLVLVQLYTGNKQALHDKNKSIVVYNALLTGDGFRLATHSIAGPIKRKQNQAALLALDLLRRYLQNMRSPL